MLLLLVLISCEKVQMEPVTDSNELQEFVEFRVNPTVPFRGEYSVHTIVFPPESPCEDLGTYLLADGKSLHLGKSTWESCGSVDFGNQIPFDCSAGFGAKQVGSMTFTAADGSKLFGTFTGIFNGQVGCGDYLITSGNGRFTGATGEGDYEWINIEDAPNPLTFIGTVTNP